MAPDVRKKVVLVDYGVGNLKSVRWALEAVGAEVIQTSEISQVIAAERLVLPGVGAFGHCMDKLRSHGLFDTLKAYASSGRPMLGICVGMQMLMESSDEFGFNEGLAVIPGRVEKIQSTLLDVSLQKVPCVGWSPIYRNDNKGFFETPLDKTVDGAHFYFVHSYSVIAKNPENILAETFYFGKSVVAAIQSKNIFGVQFHPEKSSVEGLLMIKQFLSLRPI